MIDAWYIWIVAVLLAGITLGFCLHFLRPALRLRSEFARVIGALETIRATATVPEKLRQRIATEVMGDGAPEGLVAVWREFAQTLHFQHGVAGESGHWRATALAEIYFTDQALVDTPLKTDYYKHLPGILTGLGIIGTFTGLIIGLSRFDVSIDPAQAQAQLRALINAVGHAFIVSAIAITLAMLFTWIEKSLVTTCYRLTEHIRQAIDGFFESGADVEYLERLVAAAERSARDMGHLNASLADRIVQALDEQTRQQVAANERGSERVSAEISQVLSGGLAQPVAAIARAVDALGVRQDDTVARMIGEVTQGFSSRMENLFSGQMQELHGVLSRTNAAMLDLVGQFGQMSRQFDQTGKQAVDSMSARLESAVRLAEERQQVMQQQLGSQAEHLRTLIANSQQESALAQQSAVEHLTQAVAASVVSLTSQIERLISGSVAAQQALQESVAALERATGEAIRGMNTGAERLGAAASDFAVAGGHVTTTLDESSKTADKMRLAANSMQKSAEAAQQILGDYDQAHDAFAGLIGDLRETVDRARREASLSAEISDRLEAAAGRLAHAQQQADVYLDGVSKVLGHAHQVFAESVERTLREANRQFQSELSQAVGLLSGAIVDLGETVEALAEQKRA